MRERLRQHKDILRSLTAMLAAQHVMNERQVAINHDIQRTLDRLEITQARIETLLSRMIRHEDNGQDA
jgi:predicted  nucleic acid-binding Zn-ribbon protein